MPEHDWNLRRYAMTQENRSFIGESGADDWESTDVSRRTFLSTARLVGIGAAAATVPTSLSVSGALIPSALAQGAPASGGAAQSSGSQPLDYPGKEKGLVVLGERPLVAETPEHLLDDETTPTAKFFIRNNGQIGRASCRERV